MNRVLKEMIEIYQPDNRCWMNYRLSRNNPYTFHHINEEKYGGLLIVENGAILTRSAHNYLNYLEARNNNVYIELNNLFLWLNRTYAPPTDEYYEEVKYILKKVNKRK